MTENASAQASARGAISTMLGPLQVRGVSADPDESAVYVSLCREDVCAVYLAGESDRLVPVLEEPDWDYRWVSAADGMVMAVRSRPGADNVPDPVSEIVRYRPGAAAPSVVRSETGRITSLQNLGGGAFAYFISTSLQPVEGCRDGCRYVPVAQRLVVVGADGVVAGAIDDVVEGLEGEAFHPWASGLWLVMPHDTARSRQLLATISVGPTPILTRYADPAEAAAAAPANAWPATPQRFNMIAEPFRVLGAVATPANVDLTDSGRAVLVQPVPGTRPDGVEIRPVSRSGSEWRAGRPRTYRF